MASPCKTNACSCNKVQRTCNESCGCVECGWENKKTSELNKSWGMRKTKMMMKIMNLMKIKKLMLILWKMTMTFDGYVELYDAIFYLFLCVFILEITFL